MESKVKIEKVRLLEKDFPANIPEDIGDKPLEVVNEAGETIALFWDTSFIKQKFTDPLEYIKHHDQIFDYWDILEDFFDEDRYAAGNLDEGEDEAKDRQTAMEVKLKQYENRSGFDLRFEESRFFGCVYCVWAMIALGRLTYPFHLHDYKNVQSCLHMAVNRIFIPETMFYFNIIEYKDTKMVTKYIKLYGNAQNFLRFLIENLPNRIYEHPEWCLAKESIDFFIEMANTSKNTELMAFLLDYKNKHFPEDKGVSLELSI